jgi:mRNA-degrading endonuclease toxin of MazEF toxin-antitoxin module
VVRPGPLPSRLSAGDIVLAWFPFSRHESQPYKKRPVLVLSHVGLNEDEAIGLVMITGNEERYQSRGAGDIRVDQWQQCNLAKNSVIRTRRIWTCRWVDLAGNVGKLTPNGLLDQVRSEVRTALGLPDD